MKILTTIIDKIRDLRTGEKGITSNVSRVSRRCLGKLPGTEIPLVYTRGLCVFLSICITVRFRIMLRKPAAI